jgi:hypothetical protein
MGGGLYNALMLDISNHRRDSAGLRYVYPVVSRRAGGVSLGINLNVNNACNWACVYCQVENLQRGGPLPIDVDLLERELSGFLATIGEFMQEHVAPDSRQLVDVAFSGNGEPTSAAEFAEVIARVGGVLERFGLLGKLPVRLITNGSLMHRPAVQEGIRRLAALGGEVWFKLDRADAADCLLINGVSADPAKAARHLAVCAALIPTWVQTCWFALDGEAPSMAQRAAYCALLNPLSGKLAGIHLYGLARPSMQPEASRLSRLSGDELAVFAAQIEKETGIRVMVSP